MTSTDTTKVDTFGLEFHTLYEADLRALRPWARNINTRDYHDQNYGQFVMVCIDDSDIDPERRSTYDGQIWMVDTYHIKPSGRYLDDRIASLASMTQIHGRVLSAMRYDFYYDACVRLTKETAPLFEKICDLNEVKFINRDFADQYDPEDVFHCCHIGHEVGYDWHLGDCGITLLRKGARKVPLLEARHKFDRCREALYGYRSLMPIKEYEHFVYENRDDDAVVADYLTHKHDIEAFVAEKRCQDEEQDLIHPRNNLVLFDEDGTPWHELSKDNTDD